MKKFLALLLVVLAFTLSLEAQSQMPQLPDNPYAYIFEKSTIGNPKDYIKIINFSSESNFTLELFGYHKKEYKWYSLGKGTPSNHSSIVEFKNQNKGSDGASISLSNYIYFAVSVAAGSEYDFVPMEKNHDLYINVFDKNQVNESNSFDFDSKKYGKFKDNVEIKAGPNVRNSSVFKIIAYNEQNPADNTYIIYYLEKPDSSEGEEEGINGKSFSKYHMFKIICLDGKSYEYSVKCKNNDLIITYDDPTIPKVQKVIQQPGISKSVIYNGILQGCVRTFNKSTYVIEYRDENSGIVKGKAQHSPNDSWTTYYYLFTFEARDGRYRATFEDLVYTPTPSDSRRIYNKTACDIMYPIFDGIINDLNAGISEFNTAEDW